MKKINYPLLVGAVIIILLFLISLYPDYFAKSDPYGKQRLESINDEAGVAYQTAPFPPSKEYPWGTDGTGRDIRSMIIYGSKITLMTSIAIALGRMLISLPVAIAAAYKNRFAVMFIKQFNMLFSAFPIIIMVLLLSRIRLFSELTTGEWGVIGFLLIILGWSKLALLLEEKIKGVLNQDFIEGEISIGKNRLEIAMQNIIPHIIPSIIVLFFLEVAMVLLIMAQIGIFSLVFTGGVYSEDFYFPGLRVPYQFDWANMLATCNIHLSAGRYWLIAYPVIAFAVSIIGFNLFGEGLRIEFDKKSSKFITLLRKIPNIISPFRLVYEMKNMREYSKVVYKKVLASVLVISIIVFPSPKNPYRFDVDNALEHVKELTASKYNGRLAGSIENRKIAEYIADKLEEYGVEPIDGEYLHEFNISMSNNMYKSELIVSSSNKEDIIPEYRNDFIVTSETPIEGSFELIAVDAEKLVKAGRLSAEQKISYRDKVLLIDTRRISTLDFLNVRNIFNWYGEAKGIIFIQNWLSRDDYYKYPRSDRTFSQTIVIMMSSNMGNELLDLENASIRFSLDTEVYKNTKGINVAGCIKGTGEDANKECIIIGSGFDYIGYDSNLVYPGATSVGAVGMELEIARMIKESGIKPKCDLIFAFWDGVYTSNMGSSDFSRTQLGEPEKNYFYLDLQNLIDKKSDSIIIDSTNIIPKNEWAQKKIKILKKNAARNDVSIMLGSIYTQIRENFMQPNKSILIIDSVQKNEKLNTPYDDITNINKEKFKDVGQMLLDTFFEISSGGVKK